MKLVIPHQDELHTVLTEVAEVNDESGGLHYDPEDESGGVYSVTTPGFSLGANSVSVPSPLKHIGLNLVAKHGHFSLVAPVVATSESRFRGVSRRYGEWFDEGQYVWSPVNARGVGYVVDGNTNENIIAISRFGPQEGGGRVVALGSLGAEPRKIESKEDRFIEWMSVFQSTLRGYVAAVYAANGRMGSWKSKTPLYLDCIV